MTRSVTFADAARQGALEHAEVEAYREAECRARQVQVAEVADRHGAVSRITDGTLRAVVDLHTPRPVDEGRYFICLGCEVDPDEDCLLWPCKTFLLVESRTIGECLD